MSEPTKLEVEAANSITAILCGSTPSGATVGMIVDRMRAAYDPERKALKELIAAYCGTVILICNSTSIPNTPKMDAALKLITDANTAYRNLMQESK